MLKDVERNDTGCFTIFLNIVYSAFMPHHFQTTRVIEFEQGHCSLTYAIHIINNFFCKRSIAF